jgi:hypothetical protein
MSDKINWLKDTDGKYKKTLRSHSAEITIETNGTASLVIDGGAPVSYATRKHAKDAFRIFLLDKPVVD